VSAAPPRIPLSVPHLGGHEARYLEECVRTNYVSSVGPFVDRFEREFAAFVQAPHAVACVNGTAALHLAMRLLDVGPGDEVFVSTLTFAASVNAILYERATPVLVDSERVTWNMDPRLAIEEMEARARTGRRQPRAVQVVHVLGQPADIEPLAAACARHGVALVEDAAEALGAGYLNGRFAGRQVGTIGRLGCFSFNGNKVITSGGGGMVVTEDAAFARRGHHLVRQARLPGPEYLHDEVGYNYRLTNVAAALGVAQLEQLPRFLERKATIAAAYDHALRDVPGMTLPPRPSWATSSRWLYSVLIDPAAFGADRHRVREALLERGIETRPLWAPAHVMAPYRGLRRLGGAVAEEIHARGLSLPSSVGLTDEDQSFVIESLMALRGHP
jgi:dTDP-4-amino-4,6-dideoxygalactose transaminase